MNNRQTTSEKILSESLRLFGEKGYFDTTTKEIAKSCGISETTLFYNFSDKLALLHQVIETYMDDAYPYLDEGSSQLKFCNLLDDHLLLADAYIKTIFSKLYIIRIVLGTAKEYTGIDMEKPYTLKEMEQHYETYLTQAVSHGILKDRSYTNEVELFVTYIMRLILDIAMHDQIYTLTPQLEKQLHTQVNGWCKTYVEKILEH